MLFPLAEGDLDSIFRDRQEDPFVYQQPFGLASATESFHNYTFKEFDLQLKGYHGDINPRNILISKGIRLFRDFGLSQLGPNAPNLEYEDVGGDYFAPECQCSDDRWGKVGQESDIGSFGCMLAKIVTYIEWRGQGFENFHVSRMHESVKF